MIVPDISSPLFSSPTHLQFEKIVSVKPGGELVPYYHFKIVDDEKVIVGHINFRIGDTRHVRLCAGHIGYEILPEYRGRSYSYHACKALAVFVRKHYDHVVLTVDPANAASIRIIEKLGAEFMNDVNGAKC